MIEEMKRQVIENLEKAIVLIRDIKTEEQLHGALDVINQGILADMDQLA